MSHTVPSFATLDHWIAGSAIPLDIDSPASLHSAVDEMVLSLGSGVQLLGFGEALHGGEEILQLRNRLFQRLVEVHGYRAIAVESSFPRGRLIDDYIAGQASADLDQPPTYDGVKDTGFSHEFGQLQANRELIEWMRQYNADPRHQSKLRFYGFDSPTEMMMTDSPRQVLCFVLDYLDSAGREIAAEFRRRIEPLLGRDADWETTEAAFDPTRSIGRSAEATQLRIETENLISELHVRRPELIAKGGEDRYLEAVHYAAVARQLLNYHAAVAGTSSRRVAELLGMRDAMMADNLAYIVRRERRRGKVLAFAHNKHLQRSPARWQLGPDLLEWWPAGAHATALLGPKYAVIGTAVGTSPDNGIGPPEAGTLESLLLATPGPARLLPTHQGRGLPATQIAALPQRTGSQKNGSYFPLDGDSFTDFDWLVVLDSVTYNRGGPALP